MLGWMLASSTGGASACQSLDYQLADGVALREGDGCAPDALSVGDTVRVSPGQVLVLAGESGRRRCAILGNKARVYVLGPLEAPLQPAKGSRERCAADGDTWRCEGSRADKRVVDGSVCSAVSVAPAIAEVPPAVEATPEPAAPVAAEPAAVDNAGEEGAAQVGGPAAANEALSVFVMNLKTVGVNRSAAELVTDLITGELDGYPQLQVLSGEDVKRLLKLEADRQAMDCAEGSSCMAELAEALGARYLLRGQVSRVDEVLRVDLSLVDSATATVVARAQARARDLEDLQRRVKPLVNNVLADVLSLPPQQMPEVQLGRRMADGDTLLAAGSVGGLAFLGGLAVMLVPSVVLGVAYNAYNAAGPSSISALEPLLVQVPILAIALLTGLLVSPMCGPALTVCAAPAAAGVGSLYVDEWFGQQSSTWRAAMTTLAVLAAIGAGMLFIIGISVTGVALLTVVSGTSTVAVAALPWMALGAAVLSLAGAALVGGAVYDVSVGVFGDVPLPPDDEVAVKPYGHRHPDGLAVAQRF